MIKMSLSSTYQEHMNTWHLNEHFHISNLNTLNVKSPDETLLIFMNPEKTLLG